MYFLENIWARIKNRVRARNTANTQNLNGVWQLTNEEMGKITPHDWEMAIKKAMDWEAKYCQLDQILEEEAPADAEPEEVLQPEPEMAPEEVLEEPQGNKCSGKIL